MTAFSSIEYYPLAFTPGSNGPSMAPGSQLGKNPQNTQMYQWTPLSQATGIQNRYLYVGTIAGANNIFSASFMASATQAEIPFPTFVNDGRTLHNTLWYQVSNQWITVASTCQAPNVTALDRDGDLVLDKWDGDIDNDGLANENDGDINGNGVANAQDGDKDGDGEANANDATPDGPTPPNYHEVTLTYQLAGDEGYICMHEPGDPVIWKTTKPGMGTVNMRLRRGQAMSLN